VGGGGNAAASALLEQLPAGAVVLCHGFSAAELVFQEELERVARQRQAAVHVVTGGRDDPVPRHTFSPVGLRELVADLADRDAYVLGPGWLVKRSTDALRWLGVPPRQLHVETVEF
jgi:ferredoxin-NADP reductase